MVRWVAIILPVVGINNRWYEIILFGWQNVTRIFLIKMAPWCAVFFILFFLCRFYCLFSSIFANEYKTDEISD